MSKFLHCKNLLIIGLWTYMLSFVFFSNLLCVLYPRFLLWAIVGTAKICLRNHVSLLDQNLILSILILCKKLLVSTFDFSKHRNPFWIVYCMKSRTITNQILPKHSHIPKKRLALLKDTIHDNQHFSATSTIYKSCHFLKKSVHIFV